MTPLLLLAALLVGTLGVARATRLLVYDSWPPVRAIRIWWLNRTEAHPSTWREDWSMLVTCPFCAAPYIAAAAVALAVWSDVWPLDVTRWSSWWWLLAVWASVSYAAAMIVVRDEPED